MMQEEEEEVGREGGRGRGWPSGPMVRSMVEVEEEEEEEEGRVGGRA